jgi:uncharacterized protein (DUF1015 family)
VYARAAENLEARWNAAPLIVDYQPSFYLYRQQMGGHVQTGIAACFSVDEYEQGVIKKHEKTRPDKEDDRTRHILELRAQTGVVFLTYRASPTIEVVTTRVCAETPLYDFTAADGIRHTVWTVPIADARVLQIAFDYVPALYIADGHHRAASAARAGGAARTRRGHDRSGFLRRGGLPGHRGPHPAIPSRGEGSERPLARLVARCAADADGSQGGPTGAQAVR